MKHKELHLSYCFDNNQVENNYHFILEDDNEEGGSVFEPTVVFNETLKKEECLKTIKEEKRSGYKILKIDVVSHLIDKNETDLTYLQFDLQWEDSKENERICTAFIGFASNMTRQCAIVECEWYDEETTTIKPTVKPSGRYLVISKMSKQIVEQISKFVKF
uniref:Uncharacterized protein n=1 Tax=Strongyloides papillosus TaxID=174720 RepID=A0A0N5C2V6_STREA